MSPDGHLVGGGLLPVFKRDFVHVSFRPGGGGSLLVPESPSLSLRPKFVPGRCSVVARVRIRVVRVAG